MAQTSKIQWTDATWNIARGCTKVDEDCKFCYMYRESLNGTRYEPKKVVRTKTVFNLPLKLKESSKIFTSSLTDVFHEDIDSYRNEMWDIIRKCPQHTFQILTKRPERIIDHLPKDWNEVGGYKNVWMGTSVGSDEAMSRVDALISASLRAPFAKIFLSLEPLHGEIKGLDDYYFRGMGFEHLSRSERTKRIELIDWIIIGGESGNNNGQYGYRACHVDWIESLVRQCKRAKVPVFVKQLGTYLSQEMNLVDRHGGDITEWPEHLQIRQFP